jgi:hypothetical protein
MSVAEFEAYISVNSLIKSNAPPFSLFGITSFGIGLSFYGDGF